jgi:AraC-like DNA-binding protein
VNESGAWHDLAVRTLALDLLRLLFQDWVFSGPLSGTVIRITPGERNKLQAIHDRIALNTAASVTLRARCSQIGMNDNKLHCAFKQQFGMTIHEYQTEPRMQAAITLLRSTTMALRRSPSLRATASPPISPPHSRSISPRCPERCVSRPLSEPKRRMQIIFFKLFVCRGYAAENE